MKLEERIIQDSKKKDSWHLRKIGIYHASKIYDICEGKLKPEDYFKEEEQTKTSIFNFWIGNMYHDAVQKMYPDAKKEVKIKIELADDIQIVGRCDMITEVPFELKTCSRFPVLPYDSHKYQFNCYLHALKFDYGYLTYILKSSQEIKTENYKMNYDEALMTYIKNKVLEFDKQLKLINK